MANVLKDISKMAIEVALGDYGGIRDWQFAWINETYRDQAPQLNAYDKLLIAVLSDAIDRLRKPPIPNRNNKKEHHREQESRRRARESATRWIKSNRDDYVLDFVPICEHFGWTPSVIRKKIAKLIEKTRSR